VVPDWKFAAFAGTLGRFMVMQGMREVRPRVTAQRRPGCLNLKRSLLENLAASFRVHRVRSV